VTVDLGDGPAADPQAQHAAAWVEQ
jgi:hypothetical protein